MKRMMDGHGIVWPNGDRDFERIFGWDGDGPMGWRGWAYRSHIWPMGCDHMMRGCLYGMRKKIGPNERIKWAYRMGLFIGCQIYFQ